MDQCLRYWTGNRWVVLPCYPDMCPEGEHCSDPPRDGTYIGETVGTTCVPN